MTIGAQTISVNHEIVYDAVNRWNMYPAGQKNAYRRGN